MKFPVVIVGNMVGFRKPIHKIVLWALALHADNRTWRCNPSVERIAELSGIGVRYAQKNLRELEEDQHISRVGNSLGGNPGCTTIYLINKESALSKAIKSNPNKGNAHSTTLTPVPQLTPMDALKDNTPRPTVRLTPVPQHTLTTNELYITITKEEIKKRYGENWEFNREVYLRVGSDFGIKRIPWDVNPRQLQPDNVYLDHIKKKLGI